MKRNQGFSLIELIVVITIMGVMIGVTGMLVLPYIEKSRQAKDLQIVSSLCTATTAAFAENASRLQENQAYFITSAQSGTDSSDLPDDVILDDIKTLTGSNNSPTDRIFPIVFDQLESQEGKTATSLKIKYQNNGVVVVQLYKDSEPLWDSVSSK